MAIKLEVPHNGWEPRPHQENLWRALREEKIRRAVAVWHRRAGKDEVCLHHTMVSAVERVGNYWHMLPEFSQGRKAVWSAVNPHTGRRRIDEAFPQAFRANTNDNEMFIRFKNGSTWSVVGSDAVTPAAASAPQLPELYSQSGHWRTRPRGVTTDRSSRKTKAGPRSSLLPEDAIIFIPCSSLPNVILPGSPNSSPSTTPRLSHQKLLPPR